jgi:arylsulfatase A-like enzyme
MQWGVVGLLLVLLLISARSQPLFDGLAPLSIDRTGRDGVPAGPAARRVIVISIDGLAPRVLEGARAPTLAGLVREGTVAGDARSVIPSSTLPAHASMLSGLAPELHGVLWNRYEPWQAMRVTTLFSLCRWHHLRCGLFAGKTKFAHFAEEETGVERYAFGAGAGEVLERARVYLEERDPDFVLVHLAEVDRAGHAEGWGSQAQHDALERIDALLAGFLEFVAAAGPRPLVVIVTSDHGGHGRRHGTSRREDVHIPWIAWGAGVAAVRLAQPVSTLDTASTVATLLGLDVPTAWRGRALLGSPAAGGGSGRL